MKKKNTNSLKLGSVMSGVINDDISALSVSDITLLRDPNDCFNFSFDCGAFLHSYFDTRLCEMRYQLRCAKFLSDSFATHSLLLVD